MKKLLVLALAAMMAFGLTAMVGAATLDSDRIPVRLSVQKYAELHVAPEADKVFNLNLLNPDGDKAGEDGKANLFVSNVLGFTLRTNSAVTMSISETFVEGIRSLFNLSSADVWDGTSSDYLLSPNIVLNQLTDTPVGQHVRSGRTISLDLPSFGEYDYELYVESRWNIAGDWWKVFATTDAPVGDVIITIEAN